MGRLWVDGFKLWPVGRVGSHGGWETFSVLFSFFFPLILDIVCIVNNFGAAIVSYRKYLFSLFIICDFPDDGLYYVFMLTTQ